MNNFWQKLRKPFFVLAPMENVTDYVFREIVATALPSPDVLFTEFTNVDALNSDGLEATIHKLKFSKNQRPVVAQIWGTNTENFYKSAQLISKLGFDGIDINMGCPIQDIVKAGACSALINNPQLAKEIIIATKEGAKKLPVSVKTRIGFKTVVTEQWCSFLLEQDLSALTIHGRTAKQMSKVPANWEEIKKVVLLRDNISPATTIIGNGDVESHEMGLKLNSEYLVDGVMVGRGMFKNPFVFSEKTHHPSFNELKTVLIKHIDLYDEFYKTTSRPFDPMKKFFKMYINGFPGANELRIKLMETKTAAEAQEIINTYSN